jgi:hypothetical protein
MRLAQPRRARRAALLAALLVLSAPPVRAEDAAPQAGAAGTQQLTEEQVMAIAFDLLLLRPLGLVQTAIGVVLTPLAFVLAIPNDLENEVIEYLVKNPAQHTFQRPLGELS